MLTKGNFFLETISIGFIFLGFSAQSATFATDVSMLSPSCDGGQTLAVANSANCPTVISGSLAATAAASAGNGVVSAKASSLAKRDRNGELTVSTGPASAFAIIQDRLLGTYRRNGTAFSGTASVALDLLGGVTGTGAGVASVSSNFTINGTQLFSYDSTSAASGPDVVTSVISPFISGGVVDIFSFAGANANTTCILGAGQSCFSSGDLGSSLRITGISFFDATGTDVTSLLDVVSESGFDYVTGAPAHDRGGPVSPVPLPASLSLILAGIAALIGLRRRQA